MSSIAPRFIQKPAIRQEGKDVVCTTEIEASPAPTINWFKGDVALQEDSRVTTKVVQTTGTSKYMLTLRISNVSPADSASYRADVKNRHGQMTANINLNLQAGGPPKGAPSFLQKPSIRQVDGGKRIIFECRIAADPQPVLTWYRDTIVLSDGGRYKFVTTQESKGNFYIALELSDPQPVDGATYRLHAKNEHGESNANLKLNFDTSQMKGIAPQFTSKPTIRQLGKSVVFQVTLVAAPPPSITWFKGSSTITHGSHYNLTMQTDGMNYILLCEIHDVGKDDGGSYKVTARNSQGEANANLTLNLEGPKEKILPPEVKGEPKIVMENNGSQVIIRINIVSLAMPTALWSFGGKSLASGGRYSMDVRQEGGDYFIVLILNEIVASDSGNYKCTIKNEAGEIIRIVPVTVQPPEEKKPEEKKKPKKKKVPTATLR